jgi:hypothetical protein
MNRGTLPLVLAAFTAVVLLFACKGKPHDPANLTAIDSMLVQVDSLQRMVNAIDAPVYDGMDSVFRAQRDRIEQVMNDTLDRPRAMAMGNYYRAMNKSLGRVRSLRTEALDELDLARKQLNALRHDVAGGLLPEGPEKTYVDQERLYLSNVARKVTILLNSAGTVDRNWAEHHLTVDSILANPVTTP